MVPPIVMSRDDVDERTLTEIAEACHMSLSQIEDIYICTPLQISSIAESAIRTGASVYRYVFSLAPSVDLDRFSVALRRVVSVNAVLRTRLVDCCLGLVQIVTTEDHYTQRSSGNVAQYLLNDKAIPLDLGMPLFRSAIVDHKLVLTMHHAIMDHSSMPLFLTDVWHEYDGQGIGSRAPFKEFVAHCIGIDDLAGKSFWTTRFRGVPAIFPKTKPGYVPNAAHNVIQKITLSRIGSEVPLPHVSSFIEAAWALTAAAYAGSESIAFGLVLSGRTAALDGVETTLGPTIATNPVQVNIQRNMTVEGIIKERMSALRQIQTHPALHYGIRRIRLVSEAARIASGFQTLLNIRPPLSVPSESAEMVFDYMDEPHGTFGLCLSCNIMQDGILIEASSDPAVLSERQLSRVLHQFEHTLRSLMEAGFQTRLEELSLLNPHDLSDILKWNNTIPEAIETCVHELFSTRAREQSEATAVEACDGSTSYRELDEMSNRLAHELRRKGVSTGSPVAFIFEKSLFAIVAVLAIMKAGGVCVPINKSDPYARKAALVSSANVKMILTSFEEHANSVGLASDVVAISKASISKLLDITSPLNKTSSPKDLAYIIFTSGSTGVPKGVMLEHRCLVSSLKFLAQRFGWQPGCRMLQFAAYVWDISVGEIFGALLFGSCLCIPSEEARESSLANFIESNKVNWAWLTPSVLRTMSPAEVPGLQSLLSIGEPVGAEASKTWGRALRLINGWGPCEASILSTVAELTPDSRYPESIGTPVGCAIWIVNPRNTNDLVPIGAVGELLIEGPGVARGYLNDNARTAASFIPRPPWAPPRETKTTHFYRTGDLAKYHPDGSICFMGRQDNQVKVRGQRFELGEVESVLSSCSEVRDVFTTTKICDGRTELVAVTRLADPRLSGEVLREFSEDYAQLAAQRLCVVRDHVRSRLPSYMIPTVWLAVEQMPRTLSGKLDRASIREWLKTKNLSSARAALDARMTVGLTPPATAEERLLQSVWSSVLGVPERDIWRESSFVPLGGDSILAMQVASRCHARGFQTTAAAMLRIVSLATIAESSRILGPGVDVAAPSSGAGSRANGVIKANQPNAAILNTLNSHAPRFSQLYAYFTTENIDKIAPATDLQALMLAVGQAGDKGYHISFTLNCAPALDTARLRKTCEQVVQHHSILRTVFVQHGPELYQVVLKDLPCLPTEMVVEENDTLTLTVRAEGIILARFRLFSHGQLCYRLRLEIHHALYDAFSIGLIFQDLDAAYASNPLSEGRDFHSWVSDIEALDGSAPRKFWRKTLQDSSMSYLAPLRTGLIRVDAPHEQIQIHIPLRNMQTSFGTPSSVMKAAWAILLSCALGAKDVVFGEVTSNRYSTTRIIDQVRGPCINMVPVRAFLDERMTLASLITQMHDQTTVSLPYHHLGFRSIIKDCTTWPRQTLFSSALAYQNHGFLKASLRIGNSECSLSSQGKLGDSADIWVIATPQSENLEIELRFSFHTLPSEQIGWISRCLVTILEAIPSCLEQSLSQVQDFVRNGVGSYVVPPCRQTPSSDLLNKHPLRPSAQARETVLQAWKELELLSEDPNEDCSMSSCGADAVTALLLSEYYSYRGYDISTDDVVQYPSRSMQAFLLDLKKTKL